MPADKKDSAEIFFLGKDPVLIWFCVKEVVDRAISEMDAGDNF